ncbi:MAG: hypothetical protein N3A61_07340, partial [Ignavibacteria bacterium]|nr:hypothetical protein [Ignavibacteria bacterium]
MKKIITIFILLSFALITELFAQYYEGPAAGSVASGLPRNTNDFLMKPYGVPEFLRPLRNLERVPTLPPPSGFSPMPSPPEGSNVMIDPSLLGEKQTSTGDTLLINFQGFPDQGIFIPPDPIIAVGPTHIIAMVNSRFGIWTKGGSVEKVIDAEAWFNNVYTNSDCFDPKVIYDHYAKRWVMVWLQSSTSTPNTNSNFLISVSDDSIPTGLWYNYRMPSTTNGNNPANNWADYQGVGYDQNAIYITSNQFQTNTFMYC